MVGAAGRVLPMARHAVGIEADVRDGDPDRPGQTVTVRGQHAVAVTTGHVEAGRHRPGPPPTARGGRAIAAADWLHLRAGQLVHQRAAAPAGAGAGRGDRGQPGPPLVTLNLATENETAGLSVADHLAALHWYLPALRVDAVLADASGWASRSRCTVPREPGRPLVSGPVGRCGRQPEA
jgi:2-phospho-L-lactate transferase/gluconeogenesis factor (CofD/UPF0052 family)